MDFVWQAIFAGWFVYYWIQDIRQGPQRYGGEQSDNG